jgi:protein TonB
MTRSSGNFLVGSVAFTCLAGLYGQKPESAQVWPCGSDTQLIVDSNGQPLWVGSAELKQHGITMPDPKLPSSLRAAGKVTVDVLVGPDGRVKCVRAEKGHPLLRQAILDAVKSWTFRPFSAGGHPVSIYAHLDFDFGQ